MEKTRIAMRLGATIKFNREIKHYDTISPGSYTVVFNGANGEKEVQFDFEDYDCWKSTKDGSILHIVGKNLDAQTFEDLNEIAMEDLQSISEIREVYVDTGDGRDKGSDLAPLKLIDFELEVRDENETRDVEAPESSFEKLNAEWAKLEDEDREIKNLVWMNRNEQGLEEVGFLMTMEQLREECPEAYASIYSGEESYDGSYWGNDTYTITKIHSLSEIEANLTWVGFKMEESHASGELDYEYPAFVEKKYHLSRRVYGITGYTSKYLPTSDEENPTVQKWMDRFGLTDEQIKFNPTTDDEIAAELSNILQDNGTIKIDEYKEVLQHYGVAEIPKFVKYQVEFTTTVSVIAAEGDEEAALEEAERMVFLGNMSSVPSPQEIRSQFTSYVCESEV